VSEFDGNDVPRENDSEADDTFPQPGARRGSAAHFRSSSNGDGATGSQGSPAHGKHAAHVQQSGGASDEAPAWQAAFSHADPDSTAVYLEAAKHRASHAAHADAAAEADIDRIMSDMGDGADQSPAFPDAAADGYEDDEPTAVLDGDAIASQAASGAGAATADAAAGSAAAAGAAGADTAPGATGSPVGFKPLAQVSEGARNAKDAPKEKANPYDLDPTGKKAKHKHRVLIGVLIGVAVVILAGVGALAAYVHNINTKLTKNVDQNLVSELTATEPGDPFYVLLLGTDRDEARAESSEYGESDSAYRADSIMLVRIDPKNVKVTMVSIHRDTLVDLGEHGQQKINAAYSIGGASYATQVVSEFAGVDISHYAEVNLDSFAAVVDEVGGVTVNLPTPVSDPNYTGLELEAGEQTLDGHTAALLCRCRHGYDAYGDGDLYRAANQRMVIAAVVQKVLQSDPATIASTITTMADSVTTDMTVADILDLANQMKTLNVDTDIMTGMEPTTSAYINSTWYEICNVSEWQKMMTRVDQGLSPYEDSSQDATIGVAGSVGNGSGQEATGEGESSSETSSGDSTDSGTTEVTSTAGANAVETTGASSSSGSGSSSSSDSRRRN
jgi:LCP family protein required for cell wall assembly